MYISEKYEIKFILISNFLKMNYFFYIISFLTIYGIISAEINDNQLTALNAEQIVSKLFSQKNSHEIISQNKQALLKLVQSKQYEILHTTLTQIENIESLEIKLPNVTKQCIQQIKNFTSKLSNGTPWSLQG